MKRMGLAVDRSEFLEGKLRGQNRPIRPPWSKPEMQFRVSCNSCGECLLKCPTNIIEFGRGKIPQLDFSKGECVFCGDCVQVCATNALNKTNEEPPWSYTASINVDSCLAFKGIDCRSCQDPCESRAIKMQLSVGKMPEPILDASICNGCGACYSVCPTGAIQLFPGETS